MPSQIGDGNMNAFNIGYEAFKNGDSCIPSMNANPQVILKSCKPWSGESMCVMKEFKAGVQKASNEWEAEFFANA